MKKEHKRQITIPIPADKLVDIYLSLSAKERDRDFWTVKQVAALLKKQDCTVRQMIERGDLDAFKNFGTLLVYKPGVIKRLKLTASTTA